MRCVITKQQFLVDTMHLQWIQKPNFGSINELDVNKSQIQKIHSAVKPSQMSP